MLGSETEGPGRQSAAEPSGQAPAEQAPGDANEEVGEGEEAATQEFDVVQQLRLRFASCCIPHPEKVHPGREFPYF